jgi:hypothetical protein
MIEFFQLISKTIEPRLFISEMGPVYPVYGSTYGKYYYILESLEKFI